VEPEMGTLWETLKNEIKAEIPEKIFSIWLKPIKVLSEKDHHLILGCPNKFSKNWIQENYLDILNRYLEKVGGSKYSLELKVTPRPTNYTTHSSFANERQLIFPSISRNGRNLGRWLNKEFTFERFVVGKCNEFAYNISKAVASGDYLNYDSFFMISNTGLGKSHLSQAIGNAILNYHPSLRICYITSEDFITEMIYAIRNNRIEEFKEKYRRNCDVLLLEDVHFLGGKKKTQIELSHTLEILVNSKKRIIFTSALLPKDIPNMTSELQSRMSSGIITTIQRPDFETRVRIIKKKSQEQGLRLSDEIVGLLASYLKRDVRQMESVVRCLKAKSEIMGAKITRDMVQEEIRCRISKEMDHADIEEIKKVVCNYFNVDRAMLESKSRKKEYAYPRNVYAYLCRHCTSETLEKIGKSIKRNHSTILYASEMIEKKMKTDRNVKNQVMFLKKKIKDMLSSPD
jgi:chromosomal replication initiator protein